jgi:hypothetical protein
MPRKVVGLVIALAIGSAAVAWSARRLDRGQLRRFVTHRFNPVVGRLGLVGGRRSPWAYVEHVGRRSGRVYRTPILPDFREDSAYVPLPYGTDVHWLRNVRAAGHCRIQIHESVYELDEPAIITAAGHPGVPRWARRRLEAGGRRYLRLHVLAQRPGRLGPTARPPSTSRSVASRTRAEPAPATSRHEREREPVSFGA